jgi:copper(I)-binding protein
MNVRRWSAALAVLVTLSACGDASSDPVTSLTVVDARTRPTSAGNDRAAVYLTVTSPIDDLLVEVSVDPAVARTVGMFEAMSGDGEGEHHHGGSDGASGAAIDAESSVMLVAQEPVVFEAGGRHLMVEGLLAPLAAGDRFDLVLRFANAGEVVVPVDVRVDA